MATEQKTNNFYSIKSFHVIEWARLPRDIEDLVNREIEFSNDSMNTVVIDMLNSETLKKFFTDLLPENTESFLLDVSW